MSAAPSWPLVSSPPEGEASGHDCHRPRVEFRSISQGCERIFRIQVLNLFYRPSKRKMPRGAHNRSRPSKPVLSRTEKARNRLSPNGLRRERRRSPHRPYFRAAVPIWDDTRRDSRGKLPNPHTFLCTTRSGWNQIVFRSPEGPTEAGHSCPSSRHGRANPAIQSWRTHPRIGPCLSGDGAQASAAYLSSTLAPAFSSWALSLSASSLLTPSLTGFGAPSTRSLASLRPRPVMARTSLMTSIFLSPEAARTTVNSVFSSAGAAAAPPPAGPATATAAAADTPHFSSRSFASSAASSTVRLERSSTIFCRSAIDQFP